jgi:hypothetical protein
LTDLGDTLPQAAADRAHDGHDPVKQRLIPGAEVDLR